LTKKFGNLIISIGFLTLFVQNLILVLLINGNITLIHKLSFEFSILFVYDILGFSILISGYLVDALESKEDSLNKHIISLLFFLWLITRLTWQFSPEISVQSLTFVNNSEMSLGFIGVPASLLKNADLYLISSFFFLLAGYFIFRTYKTSGSLGFFILVLINFTIIASFQLLLQVVDIFNENNITFWFLSLSVGIMIKLLVIPIIAISSFYYLFRHHIRLIQSKNSFKN